MGIPFDWFNKILKNIKNEKTYFNINGFGDNSRFFPELDKLRTT